MNMDKKIKTANPGRRLPEGLRPFFWDVEFEELSTEESSGFIINRLMEHGNEAGMIFMLKAFSRMDLIRVLKKSRSLSKRSRAFWKIFLEIEEEPCIPKRYPTPMEITPRPESYP
ncbi:DUF6922 domain-containing protein [Thermodesulfobacteriota bacterium]